MAIVVGLPYRYHRVLINSASRKKITKTILCAVALLILPHPRADIDGSQIPRIRNWQLFKQKLSTGLR